MERTPLIDHDLRIGNLNQHLATTYTLLTVEQSTTMHCSNAFTCPTMVLKHNLYYRVQPDMQHLRLNTSSIGGSNILKKHNQFHRSREEGAVVGIKF